jgi:biopolymer transport protein ExbD
LFVNAARLTLAFGNAAMAAAREAKMSATPANQTSAKSGARARMAPSAEPNVIPFIDILLVLLIIFMVTAPRPDVDINVDMPSRHSRPEPVLGAPTLIVLREEASGLNIYVGDERVDMASLGARTLAHVITNNPQLDTQLLYSDGRVIVRADQGTAYGNVVNVMDVLKVDGFARVGIFAETAQES